jgi:hypothetical protein
MTPDPHPCVVAQDGGRRIPDQRPARTKQQGNASSITAKGSFRRLTYLLLTLTITTRRILFTNLQPQQRGATKAAQGLLLNMLVLKMSTLTGRKPRKMHGFADKTFPSACVVFVTE